jgi:hypothetical protein
MDEINLYKKKYIKYKYKYKKFKKLYDNLLKNETNTNIGSGSNGIVYHPRLPYISKNLFSNTIFQNNLNNMSDEVGKIFFKIDEYSSELKGYKNIFAKYNLNYKYFNMPLHYGIISNQICFKKGVKICENSNDNIKNIYKKLENIIYSVKFLNEKKILFDDLKLSNIIEVDSIYKIIDFSSLILFNDMNYDIFSNSILEYSFYMVYASYLNKLLKYYLMKRERLNISITDLINDLNVDIKDSESKQSINFIINFSKLINKKYELNNISFEYDLLYNKSYNLSSDNNYSNNNYVNINIKNIDDILLFYMKKDNFNNIYKIYFEKFINYYEELYNDNINLIIEDIMKRINLYSLGITIFSIINSKIKDINIINKKNNIIISTLLKIVIILTSNIFINDSTLYISEPNIDDVIKVYNLVDFI